MGRRRRKVIRAPRKKLPTVFLCPKCGINAVQVISKNRKQALVKCGSCGFDLEVPTNPQDQPVDLYCKFTDMFYSEK
jgi:transcription elongation factor Elf1